MPERPILRRQPGAVCVVRRYLRAGPDEHSSVWELRRPDANMHRELHLGELRSLHRPGSVRAQHDADLQRQRHPGVHANMLMGKVFVRRHVRLHSERDAGLRQLRHSDLQRLRTLGCLPKPGVFTRRDPNVQRVRLPDVPGNVRLGRVFLHGCFGVRTRHFASVR